MTEQIITQRFAMRNTLRLLSLLALTTAASLTRVHAQGNVGINTTGAAPNAKALLDMDVSALPSNAKRGLLIPRMTMAQRIAIPGMTATAKGLWVYQTDDPAIWNPAQAHGFWYYDGTQWQHMTAGNGWYLAGNGTAVAPANFLGTTGAQDLLMRSVFPLTVQPQVTVNNATGYVGINTTAAPVERLELKGGMRLFASAGSPSVTDLQGVIRYQTTAVSVNGQTVMPAGFHYGNINSVPPHFYNSAASATSVGTTVTVASTVGLYVGDYVTVSAGTGAFYSNSYIVTIPSGTTFTVNATPTTPLSGGAVVSVNATKGGWYRMENAERQVLTDNASVGDYSKDTLVCGAPGLTTAGVDNAGIARTNFNTPFPSNVPMPNRGFRVQYVYPSADLVTAGLCAGNITGIAFYALQTECLTCPPLNTFPCAYNVEVRAGISPISAFSLGTPNWDEPIRSSVPLFTAVPLPVVAGLIPITFNPPVAWSPGQNLVVDVSWIRSIQNGISPSVELQGPLPYNATRGGQDATSSANGNTYDDAPVVTPAAAVFTNQTSRPVTRFSAQVKSGSTVLGHANYVQYAGAMLIDSVLGPNPWAATAGNYRGPGTVHARDGVYDGNLRLSDHVLDRYFDGKPKPEDAGSVQGYAYVGLPQMKDYLQKERHLPNMPSRDEWEKQGLKSLGTLQTGLWETVEDQALRIGELEKDLNAMEGLAFGKMTNDELEKAIADVNASRRLTDEQKLHLAAALRQRMAPATKETH